MSGASACPTAAADGRTWTTTPLNGALRQNVHNELAANAIAARPGVVLKDADVWDIDYFWLRRNDPRFQTSAAPCHRPEEGMVDNAPTHSDAAPTGTTRRAASPQGWCARALTFTSCSRRRCVGQRLDRRWNAPVKTQATTPVVVEICRLIRGVAKHAVEPRVFGRRRRGKGFSYLCCICWCFCVPVSRAAVLCLLRVSAANISRFVAWFEKFG